MPRFSKSGPIHRAQYQATRAHNATTNFLVSGSVKGYRPQHPVDSSEYVMRQGGRQGSDFSDKWRIDLQFDIADPSRIAVVIYCSYVDLMSELFDRPHNFPTDFDLFITNASGADMAAPKDLERMRHSTVVEVENHGRDIFPIVQLVNSGILDPYDLILKLHTKKSPWHEEHADLDGSGVAWKDQSLSDLVGSREKVEEIFNASAADSTLGLVTAADSIISKELWGGNQRIVEQLIFRIEMSIDPDELELASGPMYWIRVFIPQGLRAFNLTLANFGKGRGRADTTTIHAIERIVGIVTDEASPRTVEASRPAKLASEPGYDARGWRRSEPGASCTATVNAIPFYLPRFHKPEGNNRWWGRGFTEWLSVAVAIPARCGHYQFKQPTDLGYYDLELDRVRMDQVNLAVANGIDALVYYYYWFSGKKILNRPIEKLRASGLDFPFCIMWANEDWAGHWDGRSQDILIGQDYSQMPAESFVDGVMEFLLDPRYLRADGKTLIAVCRPAQTDSLPEVVATWREHARAAGVGEPKVLAVAVAEGFDGLGQGFREAGLGDMLQFPPHNLPQVAGPATEVGLDNRWRGNLMSYRAVVEASLYAAPSLAGDEHPGAMVGFDNIARRQWKASMWYGLNPYTSYRWTAGLVRVVVPREVKDCLPSVNAQNEWAESAVPGPTVRFGRTYLLAIRSTARS